MENIINIITHKKYCRKKPDEKTKTEIINKISIFKNRKDPLKFVVLFGGYKNPKIGTKEIGLSEILTIKRLADIMEKIENCYPYGAELYIITTGKKGEIANGITSDLTDFYENQIQRIVENFSNIKVIPIGDLYNIPKIIDQVNAIKSVKSDIKNSKNNQEKKIKIAMKHNMKKISEDEAARNVETYAALTEIEPIILKEYFGNHIKLSFRQEVEIGAVPMFTCKKGMVKQPWNGICNGCKHTNHCLNHIKTGKIIYS